MLPDGIIERTYPAEFLDDITVVDTPGTNAIIREHEALTQQVRAPLGSCALRHLGRSPLYRERTRIHGRDS